MSSLCRATRFAIAASSLLCAGLSQANTFYYDGLQYEVYVNNVPDFDQLKSGGFVGPVFGLPNDGKMYCVPTSAVNLYAYIANHGYPKFDPGPGNWELSPPTHTSQYNFITGIQLFTGVDFGTDSLTGTGGVEDKVQNYVDFVYPGLFAVTESYAHDNYAPTVRDAALSILNGGMSNICMGWYQKVDIDLLFLHLSVLVREGGHCVTVVGAKDRDGVVNLVLHDPAKSPDDDTQTQSAFTDETTTYTNVSSEFAYKDANGNLKDINNRTLQLLDYSGGYLDDLLTIKPKYGFSYANDRLIYLEPLSIFTALRGDNFPPKYVVLENPLHKTILDVAIDPIRPKHPYLVADTDAILQIDTVSGETSEFAKVHRPLRLIYGRDEKLYVLRHEQLDVFDWTGKRLHNIGLKRPLDAIASDAVNDRIAGLDAHANKLYWFSSDLNRFATVQLPAVQYGGDGKFNLTIGPNGLPYVFQAGSHVLVGFAEGNEDRRGLFPFEIQLPAVQRIDSVYIDEAGRMFVAGDGSVIPIGTDGQLDRSSPFMGLPAGEGLSILRPYANLRPNPVTDPSFINVLPPYATP